VSVKELLKFLLLLGQGTPPTSNNGRTRKEKRDEVPSRCVNDDERIELTDDGLVVETILAVQGTTVFPKVVATTLLIVVEKVEALS
jgi:hypothetical protein